ncbi:MAG: exo-alpha-sialidase [Planctomycetaceae bacterium]|nr:exo-alpha-sialidase [Planctomycetaceae bacterium]
MLGRLILISLLGFFGPILDADDSRVVTLDAATRDACLSVLRDGLRGDDFWPSMHAAEGLTLGGHGDEVIAYVTSLLATEQDDQRRCGLARELVRAGERHRARVMLDILGGDDPHGHVHAAESLYKVVEIGDGTALRAAFAQSENETLRLMAAAALGRCGNPEAMAFLREMLNHEQPETFRIAAWVLGRIGDESDIPRLKQQLPRCPDDLTRVYVENSLAALGDAEALSAMSENLQSDDPAIRTYAAMFAGDARALDTAARLKDMLDDPHADARIRAAQSLLVLSRPAPAGPSEDISELVFTPTKANPRYTEGSIIELKDGSLLFAITEFQESDSDFAKARIVARRSTDGGRTWGESHVLQENTGGLNVMSVTFRRVADDRIGLFYLQKNSFNDLDMLVRFSDDEAATFGEPILVTPDEGYHVVNNDRITQLSSGRLLAPAASTPDVQTDNHFVSHCYLSDDGGQSWRPGKGHVDADKRGAMEPEVIELSDGRVMMLVRTQLGIIGKSYSDDGGSTWSEMESLGLKAPEAPATLRRIPSTGDLLLIWNNTFEEGAGHGGRRTPLTAAVSPDEGETWHHVRNLETNPESTFSYTSLIFVQDRTVMSYWETLESGRYAARFRSLPVSWFYAE